MLDHWGPKYWKFLHNVAYAYTIRHNRGYPMTRKELTTVKRSLLLILSNLPCPTCSKHAIQYFIKNPFFFGNAMELNQYIINLHNDVNLRILKAVFSIVSTEIESLLISSLDYRDQLSSYVHFFTLLKIAPNVQISNDILEGFAYCTPSVILSNRRDILFRRLNNFRITNDNIINTIFKMNFIMNDEVYNKYLTNKDFIKTLRLHFEYKDVSNDVNKTLTHRGKFKIDTLITCLISLLFVFLLYIFMKSRIYKSKKT